MNIGKKSGLDIDQMTQVVISNSSNVSLKDFSVFKMKKTKSFTKNTRTHAYQICILKCKMKKIQKTKQEDIVSCVILAAS